MTSRIHYLHKEKPRSNILIEGESEAEIKELFNQDFGLEILKTEKI